uniref:L-dopachrome isomerase n=1 Tax=Tetraselmis chuii TaxID=63592 RepID=A0A7S1SZM4_9CHLO|mmetsp:Transcript_37758/g.67676  ORF Transcript_37758/g.67676 Transcript_37758/m.67676 type:complete len:232 (+) Transcript_37758:1-696(+)
MRYNIANPRTCTPRTIAFLGFRVPISCACLHFLTVPCRLHSMSTISCRRQLPAPGGCASRRSVKSTCRRGRSLLPKPATVQPTQLAPRTPIRNANSARAAMPGTMNPNVPEPFKLPGDPSIIVHTNVSMDPAKKKDFMQAMSSAIASTLSKPESYVAVLVMDGLDLIWAGEDTPCALASLTSLGAINPENNTAFSAIFADAVAEFGIPKNRYYITFTDVPRSNMGYNGATF